MTSFPRCAAPRLTKSEESWLPIFFGIAACSWMPHWACHYYRLETGSSFVVGSWKLSPLASLLHLAFYTGLISLSLIAIRLEHIRAGSALLSGVFHTAIGFVHVVRLVRPFRFEVFNLPWSNGASAREVVIVTGFGMMCLAVAWRTRRRSTVGQHQP